MKKLMASSVKNWSKAIPATSLLAAVSLVVHSLTSPAVTRGEEGTATNVTAHAAMSTGADGAKPEGKATTGKTFRFDVFSPSVAVAAAGREERSLPGLKLRLSEGTTLSIAYTHVGREDIFSLETIDGKDKAVSVGLGNGKSGLSSLKGTEGERNHFSLFMRPRGLGGSGGQYLSGKQEFMRTPEGSMAVGFALIYRVGDHLTFDTTAEKNERDGDRWVGSLNYIFPNQHVLSVLSRYATESDFDLDGTPTVMLMYTIPLGAHQGRK